MSLDVDFDTDEVARCGGASFLLTAPVVANLSSMEDCDSEFASFLTGGRGFGPNFVVKIRF
jgi:hypothetical protein